MPRALLSPWNWRGPDFHPHLWHVDFHAPHLLPNTVLPGSFRQQGQARGSEHNSHHLSGWENIDRLDLQRAYGCLRILWIGRDPTQSPKNSCWEHPPQFPRQDELIKSKSLHVKKWLVSLTLLLFSGEAQNKASFSPHQLLCSVL